MSAPAQFQSSKGGAPFPRSAAEWVAKGMTPEQAEHKMRQDVFGHDYATDAKGEPIEKGKGSAAQPTAQHQQALEISRDAELARKMRQGWHPGLEGAFDPRIQAAIDAAVEARLREAKPRKTPGRKKRAAPAQSTPDAGA